MNAKLKKLWQIFAAFFKIGAFTFGGGLAMIPLIQKEAVENHGWVTDDDILEIVAIAESTPGPIAINAATFVGTRIAGLPGAVMATLGCILPSCLIVSLLSWLYRKYRSLALMQSALAALRPVVVDLIAGAGLSLLKTALFTGTPALATLNWPQAVLFLAAFFLLRWKKPSPILTMFGCGLLYLLLHLP